MLGDGDRDPTPIIEGHTDTFRPVKQGKEDNNHVGHTLKLNENPSLVVSIVSLLWGPLSTQEDCNVGQ